MSEMHPSRNFHSLFTNHHATEAKLFELLTPSSDKYIYIVRAEQNLPNTATSWGH
jgi:hypothetical protein